jgi:hypothetical protein
MLNAELINKAKEIDDKSENHLIWTNLSKE